MVESAVRSSTRPARMRLSSSATSTVVTSTASRRKFGAKTEGPSATCDLDDTAEQLGALTHARESVASLPGGRAVATPDRVLDDELDRVRSVGDGDVGATVAVASGVGERLLEYPVGGDVD